MICVAFLLEHLQSDTLVNAHVSANTSAWFIDKSVGLLVLSKEYASIYVSDLNDYWKEFRKKLTSKISKPAISSTPMKYCLLFFVSRDWLTFLTSHWKNLSYRDLARAPTE